MKKIFNIVIILIFLAFPLQIQGKEVCDCLGSCVNKYPRDVPYSVKLAIKKRDGYAPRDRVEIDHIIPLCIGGTNNPDNLQALTPKEHEIKTKHDLLLLYYVESCLMTIEEAQYEAKKYQIKNLTK